MAIHNSMTTDDPMTTIQVMKVQLEATNDQLKVRQWKVKHSLVRIHSHVRVGCKYGGNSDGGTKVRERVNAFSIPRHSQTEGPGEVGKEENDS